MSKIAFIGLGNMGGPMAANLVEAGHEVLAVDLVPELVEQAVEAGASAAESAAAAAKQAEIVVSMLPSGKHVEDLYLGEGAVLENADNALLVDCSTIDPASARKVAEAAAERGLEMIDAPVSGGVGGAKAATLTFICGGPEAAVEKARPILQNMGKAVFRAGDHGAGQVAKICNNMLLAVHMIGTSEALNLGVANGLDPKVLSEIMQQASGNNWSLQVYNPYPGVMDGVPASNDYQGGFLVDLMLKDLGLAMDAAESTGTQTPLGKLARDLYESHSEAGAGKLDFSSILRFLHSGKAG